MAMKRPAYGWLKPEGTLAGVRLWRLDVGVGAETKAELFRALPADEVARAEAFGGPAARRRYAVTRGALRTLLGSLLDLPPKAVQIEAGPFGKPCLAGIGHGLHFNVSHSGGLALICIAAHAPVGVDVEMVRPVRRAAAIAKRRFSAAEASFVEEGDAPEIPRRFLRCWTRREALLKAIGVGLDFDLRSFSVPLAEMGGTVSIKGPGLGPTEHWRLLEIPIGDEHVAALAMPASMTRGGWNEAFRIKTIQFQIR